MHAGGTSNLSSVHSSSMATVCLWCASIRVKLNMATGSCDPPEVSRAAQVKDHPGRKYECTLKIFLSIGVTKGVAL